MSYNHQLDKNDREIGRFVMIKDVYCYQQIAYLNKYD